MGTPQRAEVEKRLNPIIDLLDAQNWKPALKNLSACLEKSPGEPFYLVLKALALARSLPKPDAVRIVLQSMPFP